MQRICQYNERRYSVKKIQMQKKHRFINKYGSRGFFQFVTEFWDNKIIKIAIIVPDDDSTICKHLSHSTKAKKILVGCEKKTVSKLSEAQRKNPADAFHCISMIPNFFLIQIAKKSGRQTIL